MWLFLIFALPLALAHAMASWYPAEERDLAKRTIVRGLVVSIPLWFIARWMGSLVPALPGSPLLALHELFDRFIPYSLLPLLGYALFWRLDEKMEADSLQRRMTAFYGASLAPIGFGEMTRAELSPELFSVVLLPIFLIWIVAVMPSIFRAWIGAWTSRRLLLGGAYLLAGILLSLVHWLLLARLWYVAVLIMAAGAAQAWFVSMPGLWTPPAKKVSLSS